MRAASVLISALRIAGSGGVSLNIANAIRLSAFGYHEQNKSSCKNSLIDTFGQSFRAYRSTAHYQTVWLYGGDFSSGAPEDCDRFMQHSAAFERFFDEKLDRSDVCWDPWRVPSIFEPRTFGILPPLSENERAYLDAREGPDT